MSDNPFAAPEREPARPRAGGRTYGSRGRRNRQAQEARKAHSMMVVAACIYSLSAGLLLLLGIWGLTQSQGREVALIFLGIGAVVALGPIGTFTRRKWCLPPMYIMSALSILSIPLGTIAALLVFFNAGKAKTLYR